jgi:hypothetical protein
VPHGDDYLRENQFSLDSLQEEITSAFTQNKEKSFPRCCLNISRTHFRLTRWKLNVLLASVVDPGSLNPDPDPTFQVNQARIRIQAFDDRKLENKYSWKLFWPSALKREHPELQKMKFMNCFLFFWVNFAPLYPDPDSQHFFLHMWIFPRWQSRRGNDFPLYCVNTDIIYTYTESTLKCIPWWLSIRLRQRK